MNHEEARGLAAARTGDRRAFDQLCQSYRPEIVRLCLRFVHRPDDAEDVTQEVFARAWQHLESYRSEASFRTWLWEIGRNLCLNHLRARKSQLNQNTFSVDALPTEERERTLDLPDSRPTPEAEILDAAHHALLRETIARHATERKWETNDWNLFLLRIEREISYAEFAQNYGRDEAYWRNRWRDKIKPVLERVRDEMRKS